MTQTLARTAARHPWRVVIAWIAAIVLAVVLVVGFLGDGLTSDGYVTNDPESLQAYDLMGQRYGRPDGPEDFVVLRSDSATANDPAFRARLASLTTDSRWKAPEKTGLYPLTVTQKETGESMALNVFVLVPLKSVAGV